MNGFIAYEIKVAVLLFAFYLFYRLFLKRETFHHLNRAVLTGSVYASFLLPLLEVKICRPQATNLQTVSLGSFPVDFVESGVGLAIESTDGFWSTLVSALFWGGVGLTFVRILFSVVSVLKIISHGERVGELDGCKIIIGKIGAGSFSWMNYIVLSQEDFAQYAEFVVAHEKTHVRYRHSVELLLIDILFAFQWFNPIVRTIRSLLKELHEYEVDDKIARSNLNTKEYQYLLLKRSVQRESYSIVNSFHSSIRNRIIMMTKPKSSNFRALKVLCLLPLICLCIALQARVVYVPSDVNSSQELSASLTLNVSSRGIECNGEIIQLDDISKIVGTPLKAPVIINADSDVPMSFISGLRDELRKVGVLKVQYASPSNVMSIISYLPPLSDGRVNVLPPSSVSRELGDNSCKVLINSFGICSVDGVRCHNAGAIVKLCKDFIESHRNGFVCFAYSDMANYGIYQHIYGLLTSVYSDVRNEKSLELFGKSFSELAPEEQSVIWHEIPINIIEDQ